MNKSKIEWVKNQDGSQGYTINPVKGLCPVACDYCYARAMYKRFKWNPEIRFEAKVLDEVLFITNPSRIFVGSTIELFDDWVKPEWMYEILGMVKSEPWHTFIFLTKQPQNLIKFNPYPQNVWVGVSVTKDGIGQDSAGAIPCFEDIEAKVKFISFEPLQERINFECYTDFVDWVIIGAQTPYSVKTFPKWEWIKEIIDAADKARIPVFLKNNLRLPKYNCEGGVPFYKKHPSGTMELRQEFPKWQIQK